MGALPPPPTSDPEWREKVERIRRQAQIQIAILLGASVVALLFAAYLLIRGAT